MIIKRDFPYSLKNGANRPLHIWLPDSYFASNEHYPVMYFFDGHNLFTDEDATYGKCWGMKEYMDETETPMIIVAVDCNHSPDNGRLKEYSPFNFSWKKMRIKGEGKQTMDWFTKTLKPMIDERYPTLPDREHTYIAGSSMGGLIALYGVTAYNHIFRQAACLSPSLWVSPGKVLEMVARAHIRRDTTIYMDYGSEEMFNHAANAEALISTSHLLLTKRVNLALRVVPGGNHSEASWERQIPIFMECLGL